jgi:hypothetical protein
MRAWLGSLIYKCIRAHDRAEVKESPRTLSSRMGRTLEERLEGSMPSLIAFRIENGFLVDTQSGMVFCKGAQEIAEAVVNAEAKQKLGLSKSKYQGEAIASNGGF